MKKTTNLLRSAFANKGSGLKKLLLASLLTAASITQSDAQGTLSTGLVHHYCLNSNANDAVGANHGTVYGAVPAADRFGAAGMAYQFDGIDDYIDLPDDIWVSGDFTISGWLEVTAFQAWQRFFEFGNGPSSDNTFYSPNQYTATDPDIYKVHRNACVTATTQVTGSVFPISTGATWVFVTVVQRGSMGEIYRNGALISSAAVNPPCSVTRTQDFFGRSNFSNPYFKGRMDDIRIYNRALTTSEIGMLTQTTGCEAAVLPSGCSDSCYWRVEGNNILAPTRNILGTVSNHDVRLFTSNSPRGIWTNAGDFGWNTMAPTAKLHVDVTGLTSTNGIRFEGLLPDTDPDVITVDANGNLHTKRFSGSGSVNSCSTIDFLPKTATTSGDMVCSQVYDDGTSVGIGTTGPFGYSGGTVVGSTPPTGFPMTLDVNGLARTTTLVVTSDAKFKTNVATLEGSLEKVLRLNAVEYNWRKAEFPNRKFDELKHSGFIAQELLKVLPNAVILDEKGDYAVDYISIIPVLAQAIQEQQKQIEQLKALLEKQQGNKVNSNNTDAVSTTQNGFLAQNVPNPFSASTVIRYELPKGTQSASIGIYDMNGKEIKLVHLSSEKTGAITIQGGDLMPGMYLYSLIVDGNYFDSKKMILTSQ